MRAERKTLQVGVLALALAATIFAGHAPAAENYKMTTDVPPGIASPDKVETRLGTLNFFDGFPDDWWSFTGKQELKTATKQRSEIVH